MTPPGLPSHEPHPACEAHSISIATMQQRIDDMQTDWANYKTWRENMEKKVDALRVSLHAMELRLYTVIGGAIVLAYTYQHWGPK